MSKQDKLALTAASQCWKEVESELKDVDKSRVGIYFCVGILPFEDRPLDRIASFSQNENAEFDYQKFSDDAFNSMNPLLTFKCLPNMPLFHISYNLGITGRYVMTYPSHQDLFESIVRAKEDLETGIIDYAIVGAACDQNNFLVQHHIKRMQPELIDTTLDCAATIILTSKSNTSKANITSLENHYEANSEGRMITEHSGAYHGSAQLLFDLIQGIKVQETDFNWKLAGNSTRLTLSYSSLQGASRE